MHHRYACLHGTFLFLRYLTAVITLCAYHVVTTYLSFMVLPFVTAAYYRHFATLFSTTLFSPFLRYRYWILPVRCVTTAAFVSCLPERSPLPLPFCHLSFVYRCYLLRCVRFSPPAGYCTSCTRDDFVHLILFVLHTAPLEEHYQIYRSRSFLALRTGLLNLLSYVHRSRFHVMVRSQIATVAVPPLPLRPACLPLLHLPPPFHWVHLPIFLPALPFGATPFLTCYVAYLLPAADSASTTRWVPFSSFGFYEFTPVTSCSCVVCPAFSFRSFHWVRCVQTRTAFSGTHYTIFRSLLSTVTYQVLSPVLLPFVLFTFLCSFTVPLLFYCSRCAFALRPAMRLPGAISPVHHHPLPAFAIYIPRCHLPPALLRYHYRCRPPPVWVPAAFLPDYDCALFPFLPRCNRRLQVLFVVLFVRSTLPTVSTFSFVCSHSGDHTVFTVLHRHTFSFICALLVSTFSLFSPFCPRSLHSVPPTTTFSLNLHSTTDFSLAPTQVVIPFHI